MAANLSDASGMRTGIATAMVDYPIGDLIPSVCAAMGVKPFYKKFEHDGVRGPNMATVYSDQGFGVRAPVVFYNRCQRGGGDAEAGRLRLEGDLCFGRALVPLGRHLLFAFGDDFGAGDRGDEGGARGGRGDVVRSELSREDVEAAGRRGSARTRCWARSSRTWTCWSATKRTCRRGLDSQGPDVAASAKTASSKLDTGAFLGDDGAGW